MSITNVQLCVVCQNSVVLALPDSASTDNSTCNNVSQRLVASFGDGHALTLVFSSDGSRYEVTQLSLRYNLSDNSTFPQSTSTGERLSHTHKGETCTCCLYLRSHVFSTTTGVVTMETNSSEISARMNSTYRCLSSSNVSLSADVTVTFSDVHLEAYMHTGNLSADGAIVLT